MTPLAILSKVWPFLVAIAAVVWACRSCADDALAQQRAKQSAAELALAKQVVVHDTVVLTKLVVHLDTVLRIRTVVLTKVDSEWAKIAPAVALVPASDSACHKAIDAVLTPCEQLKAQSVIDGAALKEARDTIQMVKQDQVTKVAVAIDSVTKAYVCHINLGLFRLGCPSRGLLTGLGSAVGFAVGLVVH